VICFDAAGRVVYPQIRAETRIAEANAELLALETMGDRSSSQFKEAANRLRARLTDYETGGIPSPQRRFLMREIQRLGADGEFPTLAAEDLAARYLDANPSPELVETVQATKLPAVWACASPRRRVLALFSTATLRAEFDAITVESASPTGARVQAIPPGEDISSGVNVITSSLAPLAPGWHLALSMDDSAPFDPAADRKVSAYLWIGCAVVAAMAILGTVIVRGFGRQVHLARLKNDLVATVSHELKTPLTAMRALVDTLLDAEKFDATTTREYLQLLARENVRLSRLIDNFLTFSRLERNRYAFKFAPIRPEQIVDAAITAMGERLQPPGCRFASHTTTDIPLVNGDPDALTTALVNLMDNAWKYTGEEKRITLRTEARNGSVRFTVEDNGIGIPARETGRVFQRFYQVDQRLARSAGGCGLGLSIVQAIIEAHHGSISVSSEPGQGSAFTIELPAISK
jgi:signal transduction histidine kinase